MSAERMHADEIATDATLVGRLIAAQFPQWAGLPIVRVSSAGTENALYRVGNDMVARLPRRPSATGSIDKEYRWLPKLAPHVPLAIPTPLARGRPTEGFPLPWSVYRWLDGETATIDTLADPEQAARDLARFIVALRGIDATGGPCPSPEDLGRGVPLATRAAATRKAIAELDTEIDTSAATAAWEAALRAPGWRGPPNWIHGDIQSGNLLATDGALSAVIDWGALGVGDPACDSMPAWNLFSRETRPAFRAALHVDDATWARGRGWALSVAVIALPYYRETNPVLAGISRFTIGEVLGDLP